MTNTIRAIIIIVVRAVFERGMIVISPAGKPKIENPKNETLKIRLTKQESELLEKCAEKMKTTKTEIINKGIRLVDEELNKK